MTFPNLNEVDEDEVTVEAGMVSLDPFWNIIIDDEGELWLQYNQTVIMRIGVATIDIHHLYKGVNFLRSGGTTEGKPN